MTVSLGSSTAPSGPRLLSSSSVDWGAQASLAVLRRMLDSADDVLFELSERTNSDEQRRGYFDSMRLLRRSGASISAAFEEVLHSRSEPVQVATAPLQLKALSLRDDDEVQEEIAVANIVARVEGSAAQSLWELGLRVENIPGATGLRERIQALRPKELAEAFRKALRPLDLPRDLRLILFKLFERQLLADARALYVDLNRRLEAEGYTEDAIVRRRPPPSGAAPAFPTAAGVSLPAAPTFAAPSYALPPSLLQMLQQWQQPPTPGTPAQAAGTGTPQVGPGEGTAIGSEVPLPAATLSGAPQRLSLVHQLLEESGRHWPGEEIEALSRLLQPVVRIAMADSSFFASAQHPARLLIAGLDALASGPDAERSPRLAEIEAELQRLQQQAPAPTQIDPLDGAALAQFLGSQRSPRDIMSARVASARRAAHQQVKALGSGHDLPVGLAPFLNEIWLPLISALSLRFGTETIEWKRAADVLKRLFGESRWVSDKSEAGLVEAILDDVSSEMALIGVPPKLVRRATHLLEKGLGQGKDADGLLDLETLGARAAPAPGSSTPSAGQGTEASNAAPENLIEWRASLPVGAWFRVFDRVSDRTLWMMADVFYPEASTLSFTGFDPEVRVSVRKRDFILDLREGRAEAVNPTPDQTQAIQHLCTTLA